MKKEVFLAVFVGFILGLIITFAIWTANKSLRTGIKVQTTNTIITPSPVPIITETPAASLALSVTSPENEALVNVADITVTGKTAPNVAVAITYPGGQDIVYADTTGNFSLDLTLEGGYNQITLTAFDQNGNTAKQDLLVTFTTNKI